MTEISHPAQRVRVLLSDRVKKWVKELTLSFSGEVFTTKEIEDNAPLDRLSPSKAEKLLGPKALNKPWEVARRELLYLLTLRVLELCLLDFQPDYTYPFNVLKKREKFSALCQQPDYQKISAEVASLDEDQLNPWELAGLQILEGQEGQNLRKRTGSYFTPSPLAQKIVEKTLSALEANRCIVDPACGAGVFLLAALHYLTNQPGQTIPVESLVGQLYGLDLNPEMVDLARLALLRGTVQLTGSRVSSKFLYSLAHQVRQGNALVGGVTNSLPDSAALAGFSPEQTLDETTFLGFEALKEPFRKLIKQELAGLPVFNKGEVDGQRLVALSPFNWSLEWPEVFREGGFDAVIGNPPYVGFGDYSGVEKAYFSYQFPAVYNLKSDLLYYFIARGVEILRQNGRLGFVTSRFWKEAVFAAPLRHWLATETRLHLVEDFGRVQHFEGVLIDSCLLFLEKGKPPPGQFFTFKFEGQSNRILQSKLDLKGKGFPWAWFHQSNLEEALLKRLKEESNFLGEVAICRTGVQTGRDEVFFVAAKNPGLLAPVEGSLLRKAIKAGDLTPGFISWKGLYLIYPPSEFDKDLYSLLLAYLSPFKASLERRKRYAKNFPFYQLQWPRQASVFETCPKLVTPYKAPRNTFALDRENYFFSTDVISVAFQKKSRLLGLGLEQFMVNFLNSTLSTFQFRSYSKPVGGGQYDYYANPVKGLAIPKVAFSPEANSIKLDLLEKLTRPELDQLEIDDLVSELFELTPAEKELVEKKVFKNG